VAIRRPPHHGRAVHLEEKIVAGKGLPAAIASAIASSADRFRDSLPQQDDATILVIRNARTA
jgi:hypothetical protein